MTISQIRMKEAAKAGLILGLSLYLVVVLDYILAFTLSQSYITSTLTFVLITGLLYIFTRNYGAMRGDLGMTYGNGYGFILLTTIYAGIIYGSLYFIQTNYVDPVYYAKLQEQTIINNPGLTDIQKDQAIKILNGGLLNNPVVIIISAIFSTVITGSFVGLIVAVFTKRAPVIFHDDKPKQTPQE